MGYPVYCFARVQGVHFIKFTLISYDMWSSSYRVAHLSFPSRFYSVHVRPRRKLLKQNRRFSTRSSISINGFFSYEQLFLNEVVVNSLLDKRSNLGKNVEIADPALHTVAWRAFTHLWHAFTRLLSHQLVTSLPWGRNMLCFGIQTFNSLQKEATIWCG